jgi:hypothetical protein
LIGLQPQASQVSLPTKMNATREGMTPGSEQRACVNCGKLLPSASKMTRSAVSSVEATSKQWAGDKNNDGTISVDMCLQCQIARSDSQNRPS